jgi:hypothetical protein
MNRPTQAEWNRLKEQRTQAEPSPQEPLAALPDDLFLPDDYQAPAASAEDTKRRQRVARLRSLPDPYVRVPLLWFTRPGKGHVFEPEARLFLLVVYRSHWGQRGVKLTDAVAAEAGVPGSTKRHALKRLKSKGWVRVEPQGRFEAPIVWPMIPVA